MKAKELRDGVSCGLHNGCLNHVTHPCEGCGRINGKYLIDNGNCMSCGEKDDNLISYRYINHVENIVVHSYICFSCFEKDDEIVVQVLEDGIENNGTIITDIKGRW